MNTLYGTEAKEGDYVLVQDIQYLQRSAKIHIARVHNDKAYCDTAIFKPNSGKYHWMRKETAIIILPESEVDEKTKEVIQMNIESEKSTFESGTIYSQAVLDLRMNKA